MFANIPGRLLEKTTDPQSLQSARYATRAVAGDDGKGWYTTSASVTSACGQPSGMAVVAGLVQVYASGADWSGDPVMECQCPQEQGRDNGPEVEDRGLSVEKLVT
jgi:hypothetical protein